MAVAARKYAEAVDVMAFEEVAGYAKGLQHFHRSPAQKAAAQRIAASRLSFNDNGFNARIQQVHRSRRARRSEEHTSELQSLLRSSYAVFCLKKNKLESHRMDEPSTTFA